jgi:hypothetical protein
MASECLTIFKMVKTESRVWCAGIIVGITRRIYQVGIS